MSLIVEYIWTDSDSINFRSKTKMFYGADATKLDTNPKEYPEWTYDGSSTGDVNNCDDFGAQTECRLVPYFVYTAPEGHTADRYVLCMSKEIRESKFSELYNTHDCVCLDASDKLYCSQKQCNMETTCSKITNPSSETSQDTSLDTSQEPSSETSLEPSQETGTETDIDDMSNNLVEPEPFMHELDDKKIEEYLNAEDDDISALYDDDYKLYWPDYAYENNTRYARQESDDAINMWQVHPKIWKHRPQIGFEQEFFVIDPETGYPVGFVQSACPFTRALSHLGLRPRYTPVSGRQGPYYCANGFPRAQLREMMDEVLLTALEMEIGIAGFNYEVAPGQAEFQVFGDAWEACNDLVMLRFLLVRTAEKYGLKIDFRPVVVRGQNINNSGCHMNFSTTKMRDEGGLDYIYAFLEFLSEYQEAFPNKYIFENLYGQGVCERLTGRLETSNWRDFTWNIGTRDTSVRIPISVFEAKCGYFEDRRPAANVNPYIISMNMFNWILRFENMVYVANVERRNRAQAAKDAKEAAMKSAENTTQHSEEFTPEEPPTPEETDSEDEEPKSIAGKVLSALGF